MIDCIAHGSVAEVVLDRAATRNALAMDDWHALAAAVTRVADDGARVILLRSAVAGTFCSGSDLREISRLAEHPEERAPFRAAMRSAMDPLQTLPLATIAVVDGDCFGGGVALALACDIRVAAPRSVFAITPAKLGISYPQEDVNRLAALVGRGQAARLLFAAGRIDAAEAARIGLVEILEEDPLTAARALAGQIAANAPCSVAKLKASLGDSGEGPGRDPAHDAAFDSGFAGVAFREGLAAFRERRTPDFASGRD
ncbi:enoyl-CoA hydratase/isomerase family protein [Novosphingobium sp. KCTC 2891]|uniref:enoyl-CoA hydratase/isomerase family protein n=1 Tax=Novosphingobium sp. KCTC 2891 TaxID=2989730 RepID=UPI002222666A|nr:enoyl-CoA hydratase/isomerase family protein [Novosphingobium sp. KCTC 2891]MCW1382846.1 enoyl-CoA hydratase/isomerase family protein [Novosphingobium sp. KCTC 2891]